MTGASAVYTVDDQDPIDFLVPVPPGTTSTINTFNQNLFAIGQLSLGQHNFVVTYLGSSSTVPIQVGFGYFIQQDGTSSTSTNSLPRSLTPTGNHGTPTDAIIGDIIGGLVFISLLLTLFFFNRRRNNQRSQALSETPSTVPSLGPDVVNSSFSPLQIQTLP